MPTLQHVVTVPTLADLQAFAGNPGSTALLLGRVTMGDNDAAMFYWDATSTESAESTYLNVVVATGVATGRWKRTIVRTRTLPHGILAIDGKRKTFWSTANYVTDVNSKCQIYLTEDNTANGTAIFSEIWFNTSQALTLATVANDMIFSNVNALAGDLKSTTHIFARGNSQTITILGILSLGFRIVPQGTSVRFRVDGI